MQLYFCYLYGFVSLMAAGGLFINSRDVKISKKSPLIPPLKSGELLCFKEVTPLFKGGGEHSERGIFEQSKNFHTGLNSTHEQENPNACFQAEKPHPFLCGEKKPLSEAMVADMESIKGLSRANAIKIVAFIAEHKKAKLDDLEVIDGVGPKTIARLREYFF